MLLTNFRNRKNFPELSHFLGASGICRPAWFRCSFFICSSQPAAVPGYSSNISPAYLNLSLGKADFENSSVVHFCAPFGVELMSVFLRFIFVGHNRLLLSLSVLPGALLHSNDVIFTFPLVCTRIKCQFSHQQVASRSCHPFV